MEIPGRRRRGSRSQGSSLRARASSGNSTGQRDSGKHGAGSGLAPVSADLRGLPSQSYLKRRGERGTASGPLSSSCSDAVAAAAGDKTWPGLALRTDDESARFHSKESPGPPPRSTSGFTALLRLPFSPPPIEEDFGSRAGSPRGAPRAESAGSPTSLTAGRAGRNREGPGPAPPTSSPFSAPTYFSPPPSTQAAAQIWDAGLPSPGGDGLGSELPAALPRSEALAFGIHRGPTRKQKGSFELS